jgi:hypothetical protein
MHAEATPAHEGRSRIEPTLATTAAPQHAAEPHPAPRPAEPESRAQSGRSGLFAINKLIYRVAGGGHSAGASASGAGLGRRDERVDDEGEIPAFLRRQAN